jgi:hypothetical protein
MMGIKLNAQVIIKNLQNMHEKSLPPTGAQKKMELDMRTGPRAACKARDHWHTMALADTKTA